MVIVKELKVDPELTKAEGLITARVFAVVRHLDPIVGDGDGAKVADVMAVLDLDEATASSTLAQLVNIGLIWFDEEGDHYETEHTSYGEFLWERDQDRDALEDGFLCDEQNRIEQEQLEARR